MPSNQPAGTQFCFGNFCNMLPHEAVLLLSLRMVQVSRMPAYHKIHNQCGV